jgi:hypothetical protein
VLLCRAVLTTDASPVRLAELTHVSIPANLDALTLMVVDLL